MSISSLLTSTNDEPASNDTPSVKNDRMKMPIKCSSFDFHLSSESAHKEESNMKADQRQPLPPPLRINDIDLKGSIDSAFNGGAGKKSNSSFKDFKYHDSMKVTEDADKSDTDVDDDVYKVEKQAYLAKLRKRTLDIASEETEKRKVLYKNHFLFPLLLLLHNGVGC